MYISQISYQKTGTWLIKSVDHKRDGQIIEKTSSEINYRPHPHFVARINEVTTQTFQKISAVFSTNDINVTFESIKAAYTNQGGQNFTVTLKVMVGTARFTCEIDIAENEMAIDEVDTFESLQLEAAQFLAGKQAQKDLFDEPEAKRKTRQVANENGQLAKADANEAAPVAG